eukprot:354535-Chlamydomonas_euryale.AAC.6
MCGNGVWERMQCSAPVWCTFQVGWICQARELGVSGVVEGRVRCCEMQQVRGVQSSWWVGGSLKTRAHLARLREHLPPKFKA